MIEKHAPFRILTLITTPKLADKATALLSKNGITVEHRMSAVGTATNEILDIIGLGSIDKIILFSIMPKLLSREILKKMSKELLLGSENTGIAFTVPLTGMNNVMVKMLEDVDNKDSRKEITTMSDSKHSLIIANVNRGYSNEVMDAAREAGASGGSVINSRLIANEAVYNKWGLGGQDEKEIILIVADTENKINIMKKISEKYGVHSDAKGLVFSVAIDDVAGL